MHWSSGTRHCGQSGSSCGTRICENGHICGGRADAWSGQIFHDGSSDQSSRHQEKVCRNHTAGWESGVRNSRYSLRGVRLGEASTHTFWTINLERELRLNPMTSLWFDRRLVGTWSPGSVPGRPSGRVWPRCPPVQWHWKHQVGVAPKWSGSTTRVCRQQCQQIIPTWVDQDDEHSVSSESCWGEEEDLVGDETIEWGVCCLALKITRRPMRMAALWQSSTTARGCPASVWSPGESCWSYSPRERHPQSVQDSHGTRL